MDLYREEVLEHYRRPHNFRVPAEYDRKVEAANPLCGDQLTLYLQFDGRGNNRRIKEAAFTGVGCALSTAAASLLTDALKGRRLKELNAWDKEVVLKLIGAPVAPARLKCVILPLEALRRALVITR